MPSTLQLLLLACVSVQAITVPASGSNLATSKGNSKVSEPENEGFKAEAAKDTGYNLRMLTIKPGTLQTIKQSWLGLAKTGTYNYAPSAGAGVDVYVLDSGIKITHHDFAESRAKHFKVGMIQSVQQSRYVAAGMDDKRGHGTHVAGIIGAKRYGVAPKVHLYNVKVIGDDGKAPGWKFLYQAINDIVDTHISKLGTPGFRGSVINMSIGYDGEPDPVLAAALDNAKAVGILAFASAGNKNIDIGAVGASGGHYPCAYKAVTCIAAVNEEYQKAEISNYGAAVAFVAPGTGIQSLGVADDTAHMSLDGTSMACAHASGTAAIYLSVFGDGKMPTSDKQLEVFKKNAVENVITGFPKGTNTGLINTGITRGGKVAFIGAPEVVKS